jgi:hypothetical protein
LPCPPLQAASDGNQNANVVSVPQCRMLGPGPDKDCRKISIAGDIVIRF